MSRSPAATIAALVGLARPALGGGDEARAELRARVAHPQRPREVALVADPARADDRQAERAGAPRAGPRPSGRPRGPPARSLTRDEAVDPALEALLGPLALGHVVVDDAADRPHPVHHPARVAERGHEEAHALLERHVDPALHALAVGLRGLLDERVHADRLRGEPPDEAQPLAEVVAVDVGERDGLDDADAARLRHRGHELGVAARVHGPAEERDLDAGRPGEGSRGSRSAKAVPPGPAGGAVYSSSERYV